MELEMYEDAIKDFNKAIKLYAEDSTPIFERGLCYFALKIYDKASDDFYQVTKLHSLNHEAYYFLASIHFLNSEFEKALHQINKCLKCDPFFDHALYQKARILVGLGRFDDVIQTLEELKSRNRNLYETFFDQ